MNAVLERMVRWMPWKRKDFSISGVPELRFGRVGWEQFRDRVMSPYMQNAWVQAAVSAKATALSGVPVKLFAGRRGTDQKQELPETEEWATVIERPGPLYPSWPELMFAVMLYRDLYGESPFIALGPDGTWVPGTVPAELYVANPPSLIEDVDPITQLVERWRLNDAGGQHVLPPEQVGNFKRRHPSNPHRGLSPLIAAQWGMDFSLAAQNFNTSLMRNGADPGGVVKADGVGDWTAQQHRDARLKWEDRHQGTDKAGKVAFMDKEADYIPLSATSKAMQLREHLEWSRDEVKAVLHVTDWELGSVQEFSYASAQQAKRTLWDGLIAEGKSLEDFLWSWLFLPYSRRIGRNVWMEFDFSQVPALRYEFTERVASVAALAPHYGINQINDRLELGMEEVPWGNEPATGAMPLDDGEEAAPVFAAKSKAYLGEMKSWQETAERVMVRAARDYFRALRSLAIMNIGAKAKSFTKDTSLDDYQMTALVDDAIGDTEDWEQAAKDTFSPATRKIIEKLKKALLKQGFDVMPPDKYLMSVATKRMAQLVKVSKRDRQKLGTALRKVIKEGEGFSDVRAMAKAIDEHFGVQNSARAMTIARTEAGMVRGEVAHKTFEANGVEEIFWAASSDEHTRQAHRDMNGEVVKLGEKFSNGMHHPLEAGAPAAQVVNCRCKALPA